MDVDAVAKKVLDMLAEAAPATIFVIQEDGEIQVREPGHHVDAGADRQRRPVATFVASHLPPAPGEVARRIRTGLRKHGMDDAIREKR